MPLSLEVHAAMNCRAVNAVHGAELLAVATRDVAPYGQLGVSVRGLLDEP
jgi:hypothetical protein